MSDNISSYPTSIKQLPKTIYGSAFDFDAKDRPAELFEQIQSGERELRILEHRLVGVPRVRRYDPRHKSIDGQPKQVLDQQNEGHCPTITDREFVLEAYSPTMRGFQRRAHLYNLYKPKQVADYELRFCDNIDAVRNTNLDAYNSGRRALLKNVRVDRPFPLFHHLDYNSVEKNHLKEEKDPVKVFVRSGRINV